MQFKRANPKLQREQLHKGESENQQHQTPPGKSVATQLAPLRVIGSLNSKRTKYWSQISTPDIHKH